MLLKTIRLGLFLAVLLQFFISSAQTGNEWIQYSQFYYKIPVAQAGIHRITYNDLQNSGFPVGAVDPRRLQLFHRGIEQAIHVEGETDAVFNVADYIEFFGRRNDGKSDTELYKEPSAQPHTYHNLFNDTTAYFLTYNNFAIPGKRMVKTWEVNVSSIPQETSHIDEKLMVLTQQHSDGRAYDTYIRSTSFDVGEGWTGPVLSQNQTADYTLEGILNGIQADGLPQLEVLVAGRAEIQMPHRCEIYVGPNTSTLRLVATEDIQNFDVVKINQSINWTDVGADGRLIVRLRVLATGTAARASVSYIRLNYPQNFDATGSTDKYFQLKENPSGKSFINVQNAPAGSRLYDISETGDVVWYVPPASTFNPVISDTQVSRKLLLTNLVRSVSSIKRVQFRNINPTQHDYIIISHPLLMKPSSGYDNVVQAYAEYRASEDGGSYDTLVVDVAQLYDQFNYGEISPLAIYRFMRYMVNSGSPKYLFIIGKGLDWSLNYHRNPTAPTFSVYKDLVPSAGKPASDMMFTIGLGGTTYQPAVPTGRISATSPSQVAAYLSKVKEMEAQPFDALWRKNILHLSGGLTVGETFLFRNFLQGFQVTAENYYLGGSVTAQAKNTTNVGELVNISEAVNNGLNLITQFGHSSPEASDFDVGFVTNPVMGYNNQGRYPMFLVNGCNAADFFTTAFRYGEDWVLASNKGATGFMAHTSFGYASTLRLYSDLFYNTAFGDSVFIRKGVGDVQKEVARRYMEIHSPAEINLSQTRQMLLLGDPAVSVFGAAKPDYEINNSSISSSSLDDQPITALSETFNLNISVRNFGRAFEDSVMIRVTRFFNDNTSESYDSLFPPVLYRDTITFTIKQELNKGFGNNVFKVEIDPYNFIGELSKENNEATYNLFIPLNITKNLFPYDYSIVNTRSAALSFSSTDILGVTRDFELEVDTVYDFSSAYLQRFVVNGIIATKELELFEKDSLVYYWRTRFKDPAPGEAIDWVTSSFAYIKDSPVGWAQIDFPQYLKNASEGLVKDAEIKLLSYVKSAITLDIHTYGSEHPATNADVTVKINGADYHQVTLGRLCRTNTINLIAFDRQSTIPYMGVFLSPLDPKVCGKNPEVINSFRANELQTGLNNDIFQYVSSVKEGDSVVLFSVDDPQIASWSDEIKQQFELLGISSAQLTSILPGEPVVIYARKGSPPGTATVYRPSGSPANAQELIVNGTITGGFDSGTMTSVLIGPAMHWERMVSRAVISELPITDEFRFEVVGVSYSGEETILLSNVVDEADLTFINPDEYPYLRLIYKTRDAINLTPPQLDQWLVFYTPVAEGVLVYNGPVEQQNLKEGEIWTARYGFKNISQYPFSDSLTVAIEVVNQVTLTTSKQSIKIEAPKPGELTDFDVVINTLDHPGVNDLQVYVNPKIVQEQYYENNVLKLNQYLNVERDVFNPVLDVTIDGRYVTNGDFVSPNPKIVMQVWDENSLIKKTNTDGVKIRLTYPSASTATDITFDRDDIQWFAQTDTEYFRVEFNPENLVEGVYTLDVEVQDARENSSGAVPYRIDFEVKYENTVLFLSPYPNPSMSMVWFDLVISGELAPDNIQFQMLATTGNTVRTLEFTDLHVGINHLFWDGKDYLGNDLPAGLYVYKLVVTKDGQPVSVSLPDGEKFFKGGYGKILLNR